MRPVEAYVVKVREPFVQVKLKSGAHLWIPKVKDIGFGDKVWVCYDYTHMSVREVYTDYEYHELDQGEECDELASGPETLPAYKYASK